MKPFTGPEEQGQGSGHANKTEGRGKRKRKKIHRERERERERERRKKRRGRRESKMKCLDYIGKSKNIWGGKPSHWAEQFRVEGQAMHGRD